MKILVLVATGGTGRLIVGFRSGERPGDEANLTCSPVMTGAASLRLMHDAEAVPPMQRVDFSRVQEPTVVKRFKN